MAGLTLRFVHFRHPSSVPAHIGGISGYDIDDRLCEEMEKPNGNMCRSQGRGLILSALISCRGIRPHAGCPERGDRSWGGVGGGVEIGD